jgi:hypothetical protein
MVPADRASSPLVRGVRVGSCWKPVISASEKRYNRFYGLTRITKELWNLVSPSEEAIETEQGLLRGTLRTLSAYGVGRSSSKSSGPQSNEIRWSGYAQTAEMRRRPNLELLAANPADVDSMDWKSGRTATITELEREARSSGNFVDRAIVREIKIASARLSETDLMWSEVMTLTDHWKDGMPELQVLEAIRRINRVASCWKAPSAADSIAP